MFQGPDFEGAAGRDTRSLAGGGEAYWAVPWRWILPAGDPLPAWPAAGSAAALLRCSLGDRLAQAFEQALEVRHPLAELTDLVAEVLALAVDLRAEVVHVGPQTPERRADRNEDGDGGADDCPGGGIHVDGSYPFPAANGCDRATDDAAMGGMTGRGPRAPRPGPRGPGPPACTGPPSASRTLVTTLPRTW